MAGTMIVFDVLILATLPSDMMYYSSVIDLAVKRTNFIQSSDKRFRLLLDSVEGYNKLSDTPLADIISKYYYHTREPDIPVVIISFMGAPELLAVAPLLTGLNVPLVYVAGTFPEAVADKSRYPTILSATAIDNSVMLNFIRSLLHRYNWTTAAVLCDTEEPLGNIFYKVMCGGLQKALHRDTFKIHEIKFAGGNQNNIDYSYILNYVRPRARIIILMAHVFATRRIMVEATRLNMTNDEYVYLFMQPLVEAPWFPPLRWNQNNSLDLLARSAFGSVLYISVDVSTMAKSVTSEDNKEISRLLRNYTRNVNRRSSATNVTVPVSLLSAYEIVGLIGQKLEYFLNITRREAVRSASWNGESFARSFFNQTFQSPGGKVYIDDKGRKVPDYILYQFDNTSGEFQKVLLFDGQQRMILSPFDKELSWSGGKVPLNEPDCGFRGDNGHCLVRSRGTPSLLSLLLYISLAVVAFLLILIVVMTRYVINQKKVLSSHWILLEHEEFVFHSRLPNRSNAKFLSTFVDDRSLVYYSRTFSVAAY